MDLIVLSELSISERRKGAEKRQREVRHLKFSARARQKTQSSDATTGLCLHWALIQSESLGIDMQSLRTRLVDRMRSHRSW